MVNGGGLQFFFTPLSCLLSQSLADWQAGMRDR